MIDQKTCWASSFPLAQLFVVGTGVDPVTYRFSGGRSAN